MGNIKKLTKEEKIKAYIEKEGDPYCFTSGKIKVTLCFNERGRSIEEQLRQCLLIMRGL